MIGALSRPRARTVALGVIAAALVVAASQASASSPPSAQAPSDVRVSIPTAALSDMVEERAGRRIHNDNGKHIVVAWRAPRAGEVSLVLRTAEAGADTGAVRALVGARVEAGQPVGAWTVVTLTEDARLVDEVEPGRAYTYLVAAARVSDTDGPRVVAMSSPRLSEPIAPEAAAFDVDRWFFLFIIGLMALLLAAYYRRVRARPDDVYIRRIPGVDAIEEAVGRSTEMGRPVLYVTGVEEIQNIQTIASLLILGRVAEMTAEYDTDLKVANFFPLTMVVAEEIVKQGFANAGRIDAHRPENVMFISAEQFAFAAGVNGLILREQPATNIYLGRFFAESLMLAETGYVTRAIQIAGTAEITQLPFFIAACDYTIIGEELFAVSAYLSREPVLLTTLKASDVVKVVIMGIVIVGAIGATAGWFNLGPWLVP